MKKEEESRTYIGRRAKRHIAGKKKKKKKWHRAVRANVK